MPTCLEGGCPTLVSSGRCPQHQQPIRAQERRRYTGTPGVNYGRRWRKARARYLGEHPFCVQCPPSDLSLATQLDHVIPHDGDYAKFWDETNWQGLCATHHSAKTAREVGLGG